MSANTLRLISIHMVTLSHLVKDEELYENLDGNFKERSDCWRHILETQISPIQGFGAFYFHIWHQNLGRRLEKVSLESL